MYLFNKQIQGDDPLNLKKQKFLHEFLEKEFGKRALEADIILQPLLALCSDNEKQKEGLVGNCLTAKSEGSVKLQLVVTLEVLEEEETKQHIIEALKSCMTPEQQRCLNTALGYTTSAEDDSLSTASIARGHIVTGRSSSSSSSPRVFPNQKTVRPGSDTPRAQKK